jgi:hypothetical protein
MGYHDLIPMHFARARQRSQNQQIERSGRNFVLMQSITPDIVRLRHRQIVSGSCQDVCEDARFAQETRLEAGFRTDGRQPFPYRSMEGLSVTQTEKRSAPASA